MDGREHLMDHIGTKIGEEQDNSVPWRGPELRDLTMFRDHTGFAV